MTRPVVFTLASRILHWTMAALIIAMLFIGVAMVASLSNYHRLVSIHQPIGIAILALAAIRLINRLFNPPPPLPADMPRLQKLAAKASHVALYGLMFALPLVGWAMLSAGDYPIDLFGSWALPRLLSPDPMLHAWLRRVHGVLAYGLFAAFLLHLAAALLHGLILRDGVFGSMATLSFRRRVPQNSRS
ncbi:cytochrome b [Chelatococcus sambhunathii]|uniref:Cytochrome b n=1 Tax=Chelatococcus sambhunathii TaxID=363953 RepID=A0ABU1DCV6_9HYPH|nr:cytochrome b [Chelatococcus sambhunathii]MDR4305932.1 cytochrome b [Chelatococcus sambhunathii]